MSCKHNIFLNSNYEEQDTDRIEIDQALFRIKESLNKSENKINEALDSEVHRLTSSIAQAAEAAHHDLETTVSEINQNMTELENQLDANVILINSKIDNAETRVNSRVDNIIANSTSTEGNSELIDIRTGSDGRVYQSAGKAVRSQISDIKNTAVICANHRVTDSADEYYDANNVPPGKIIAYGNSGTNIPDLLGTLFCLEGTSANGRTQIYI